MENRMNKKSQASKTFRKILNICLTSDMETFAKYQTESMKHEERICGFDNLIFKDAFAML